MKRIKFFQLFLILFFSIFWPFFSVNANAYVWPQIKHPDEFQAMGDGKCVYYLTGGCEHGGWYSWNKTEATDKCNWEPCCKFQMTGYTSYEYMFKKFCGGSYSYGVESEEKDKSKCLKNGLSCCCAEKKEQAATVVAPTKPKFIMPELQISIPGLKLTPSSSIDYTANPDGSYQVSIPWLSEYLLSIFNYGLRIVGILAAIVLMAGGLLWLISSGDATKITQAKELITGSITGLVILMSSYIILVQINPDLTKFQPITIGTIKRIDLELAKAKLGSTAEEYKSKSCPSEAELNAGVEFYATGYYKIPFQESQDIKYLCMVHMQGTCPNGVNDGVTCSQDGKPVFPDYPTYKPCKNFTSAQYNNYFNQPGLVVGKTIAGPIKCGGKLSTNNQVCFKNHTYKITDSGSGIQGRRIDILSSSEKESLSNSGKGILKSGPCQ